MRFDYTFEELQMKMKNEILFKNELIFSSIFVKLIFFSIYFINDEIFINLVVLLFIYFSLL